MDQPLELGRRRHAARGIPTSEPRSLRHAVRRTTVVRIVLAAALIAALLLAFFVLRRSDVRNAPLVPSGTTGMIVLDLSASVYESAFGPTLQKMARQGERAGLVVFLDQAYEVLPPGTPGRELLNYLPLFAEGETLYDRHVPAEPLVGLPGGHADLRGDQGGARLADSRRRPPRVDPARSPTSRSSPTRCSHSETRWERCDETGSTSGSCP